MTATLAALVALSLVPIQCWTFLSWAIALTSNAFDEALQQMPLHLKGHPPPGTELQ